MSAASATWAVAWDVLALASRRRVLPVYLILATVVTAGLVLGTGIGGDDASGYRLLMFGVDTEIGVQAEAAVARPAIVLGLYSQVLVGVAMGFFGVGLGLLATADAVGSAFSPGRAELLLSRPIGRGQVVLARYSGGILFGAGLAGWMCLLTVALTGLKFGLWLPGFLWVAPALTLKLAIVLAVSSLVAVATRSAVLGVVAACGAWLVSYAVNLARLGLAQEGGSASLLEGPARWAQVLVPQIGHQNELAMLACSQPVGVPGFSPGWVVVQGVVWIVLALGTTIWIVSRRDL